MALGIKKKRNKYKTLIVNKLMALGLEDKAVSVQNGSKQTYTVETDKDGKNHLVPQMRPTYQLRNSLRYMYKQIVSLPEQDIQAFLRPQAERPENETSK